MFVRITVILVLVFSPVFMAFGNGQTPRPRKPARYKASVKSRLSGRILGAKGVLVTLKREQKAAQKDNMAHLRYKQFQRYVDRSPLMDVLVNVIGRQIGMSSIRLATVFVKDIGHVEIHFLSSGGMRQLSARTVNTRNNRSTNETVDMELLFSSKLEGNVEDIIRDGAGVVARKHAQK